ncbi:NADH-quinone oxidoreductase subunit C [Texcoconibacillus texcoconensis]|uniref:NADH-quinone oxidoreductase subunit C n=1 Tax=Texcoconibacillus texcoconensis TaxID=1095777 RepID=A0A840QRH7_9BACI|nr:NADH-quinone oxidoreductase subunit C [Texcoconibacillus texcoconensis]MBB5174066.1 NADH-quinone oxidoreductase subunit C [Texcoconibacillus texcoconensis]
MSEHLLNLVKETIQNQHGEEAVEEADMNFEKPFITIWSEHWTHSLAETLRDGDEFRFDFLSCLTGVDYEEHMEVVYNFYSFPHDQYLYLKVKTPRTSPSVISVQPLWKTANWHEREAYDLLGINFSGHPNLKRILLQDEWEGHPLRKDYVTDKKAMGLE